MMDAGRLSQDNYYARAAADFGPGLGRLARAYERDADRQRNLLPYIHFALWRSFEAYQERSARVRASGAPPAALGIAAIVVVLVFAMIILLNMLGVARLQRTIEALDDRREKD